MNLRQDKFLMGKNKSLKIKNTLAKEASLLLAEQKKDWDILAKGYSDLNLVKVKTFSYNKFKIKVQFNPGRITSSSAKTDSKSIKSRQCFLCKENLPKVQRGINFIDKYSILCNPFPIFPEHFTIPKITHEPQLLYDNFDDMLELTKVLSDKYTVFYNGPQCGASAPDHMHFQAGSKNFMPIDTEYDELIKNKSSYIFNHKELKIFAAKNYLRNFIGIEGSNKEEIIKSFNLCYKIIHSFDNKNEEPMINIISSYIDGKWRIIILPREKHRPEQYFAEGEKNILLSPASVDMGGILITPLEKDFNKISIDDITDILRQVSINDDKFEQIIKTIKNKIELS